MLFAYAITNEWVHRDTTWHNLKKGAVRIFAIDKCMRVGKAEREPTTVKEGKGGEGRNCRSRHSAYAMALMTN